jgi:predicted O-methyltransferase YrrM
MEHAKGGICLEIGSYKGRSASYIASSARTLICLDPFKFWDGTKWLDDENHSVMQEFLKNTRAYNNITVIKGTSAENAELFKEGYFDMIFIDAAHDFENVSRDIRNYYPKLKSPGTMLLHDYQAAYPGVQQAVHEHCGEPDEVVGTIAKIVKQ